VDHLHSESFPDVHPEDKRSGLRRVLMDTIETIIISLLLFLGINAISERIRVESISMEPNLYAGDFVLVNKAVYFFDKLPQRGDVIVFRYPLNPDTTPYIKRVIGLPGDHIRIDLGKVFVNDEQITEPYITEGTTRGGLWTVPEGQLFVMGDNRANSSDSRTWGYVPMENVIGRAELIYWPPQDWAFLHGSAALAAPTP
jgi:signal peptidase I